MSDVVLLLRRWQKHEQESWRVIKTVSPRWFLWRLTTCYNMFSIRNKIIITELFITTLIQSPDDELDKAKLRGLSHCVKYFFCLYSVYVLLKDMKRYPRILPRIYQGYIQMFLLYNFLLCFYMSNRMSTL